MGVLAAHMALGGLFVAINVVVGIWGILVWREFKGGSTRVQALLFAMLVLLSAGIVVIGIARRSIR